MLPGPIQDVGYYLQSSLWQWVQGISGAVSPQWNQPALLTSAEEAYFGSCLPKDFSWRGPEEPFPLWPPPSGMFSLLVSGPQSWLSGRAWKTPALPAGLRPQQKSIMLGAVDGLERKCPPSCHLSSWFLVSYLNLQILIAFFHRFYLFIMLQAAQSHCNSEVSGTEIQYINKKTERNIGIPTSCDPVKTVPSLPILFLLNKRI